MTVQELNISGFATRFRNALTDVLSDLKYVPPPFAHFPRGSCGIASDMLGSILNEKLEAQALYISATHRIENTSHAWLHYDGIVIDVTGDQFPGRPSVYVGQPDRWFDLWKVDRSAPRLAEYIYGYDMDCNRIYERLSQMVG